MQKNHVYILTNKNKRVLYIGVTSDLKGRIQKHKTKFYKKSFTARYNYDVLVYFEPYESINEAILREKQLKAGNRAKKEAIINKDNPEWDDLSKGWFD